MSERDYQCVVDVLLEYTFHIKTDPVTGRVPFLKIFVEEIIFEGCADVAGDPSENTRLRKRLHNENAFNLIKSDDNRTIKNGWLNPDTGLLELYISDSVFQRVYCGGKCKTQDNSGTVRREVQMNIQKNFPTIDQARYYLMLTGCRGAMCKFTQCLGREGRFDSLVWGLPRITAINKCMREAYKEFYADVDAMGCESASEFCYEEPHLVDPSNFDAFNYRTNREKELKALGYTNVYKADHSPFTQEIMDIHKFNLPS